VTSNLSRKYVESTLQGEVRLVDGTLVIFVPPPEGTMAVKARKPKKPAPAQAVA
jgi:hypothetical protein